MTLFEQLNIHLNNNVLCNYLQTLAYFEVKARNLEDELKAAERSLTKLRAASTRLAASLTVPLTSEHFDLIRTLQSLEGNEPCYGTGRALVCDQESCLWRKTC